MEETNGKKNMRTEEFVWKKNDAPLVCRFFDE